MEEQLWKRVAHRENLLCVNSVPSLHLGHYDYGQLGKVIGSSGPECAC